METLITATTETSIYFFLFSIFEIQLTIDNPKFYKNNEQKNNFTS